MMTDQELDDLYWARKTRDERRKAEWTRERRRETWTFWLAIVLIFIFGVPIASAVVSALHLG